MGSSGRFVAEGSLELGPKEDFFVFLDGEHLGGLLREHFGAANETGYTPLGRARVTVELVAEPGTPSVPTAPRPS